MKHISICAILASLLLQNEASAASASRSVNTPAHTLQELARYKESTVLDSDFLKGMDIRGILDLSSLKHVSVIGNNFLNRSLIERIVFPPNVRTIGINFLSQCANLNEVDLSALVKVITIENGFFAACINLKKINMPKCMDATHIKNDFFSYCENLTEIDFSALNKLTHIGDYFLGWCENLTEIDFSALNKLTHIGNHFLINCKNLREIDLSAFKNVRHIGRHFLTGCTKLEKVILPYNKAFESVDFPPHVNIFFADDMHMRAPSAAPYATMPPFPAPYSVRTPSAAPYATTTAAPRVQEFVERYKSATVLYSDFLDGYLISGILDLSSLKDVSVIDDGFLRGQKTLTGIILPTNLTRIGSDFLANCEKLKEIDLSALNKVTRIGPNFLEGCANLKKVILPYNKVFASVEFPPHVNIFFADDMHMRTPSAAPYPATVAAPTLQEFVERYKSATVLYSDFLKGMDISGILDLSSFEHLSVIGDDFLRDQKTLTGIILPANLTRIRSNFLANCENLKEIDLSALNKVTRIGPNFLEGCAKLKKVILPFNKAFESVVFPPTVNMIYSQVLILQDGTLKTLHPLVNLPLSFVDEDFNPVCIPLAFNEQPTTNILENYVAPPIQEYYKNVISSNSVSNFYLSVSLNLSSLRRVEHIGNDVFAHQDKIAKITLPASLISIGDSFLSVCRNITEVDFSSLTEVTHIGKNFLKLCSTLKKVDCSPLKKLSFLGLDFLRGCKHLEEFYWHDFTRLTTIKEGFLAACANLRTVNLFGFTQVTSIEDSFMAWCANLTNLKLSNLRKLTHIGPNFLGRCENLTILDLSALEKLTHIGRDFLKGCTNLTDLGGLSDLKNVTHIGSNFLSECKNLTELDLSGLTNVTSIEDDFLNKCIKLRKVNLCGFTQIEIIKNGFLANCENLREIDFSAFKNVTSIEAYFLGGCENLREIDFSAFEKVTSIGPHFLEGCTKLKKVILPLNNMAFNNVQFPPSVTNFPGIAVITKDGTFNISHTRVTHILSITYEERVFHAVNINLQGLRNTREICSRFLAGFARLHKVDLSPLENVNKIDDGFLSGCRSIESLTI